MKWWRVRVGEDQWLGGPRVGDRLPCDEPEAMCWTSPYHACEAAVNAELRSFTLEEVES